MTSRLVENATLHSEVEKPWLARKCSQQLQNVTEC